MVYWYSIYATALLLVIKRESGLPFIETEAACTFKGMKRKISAKNH